MTILVLSALLSIGVGFSKRNLPVRGRILFVAVLIMLAALLIQQNDFGGRMVYLHGVGVGKKSMMQDQHHGRRTMEKQEEGHNHVTRHH